MRYLLSLLFLCSCASVQGLDAPEAPLVLEVEPEPRGNVHFLQGFAGVSALGDFGGRAPIPTGEVNGQDVDDAAYLGGALQWGVGYYGDTAIGIEGGASLTLGTLGVNIAQGAATTTEDADLVGGSLFLGAFASHEFSGWRAYGGLGPLLQLVRFDVDFQDGAGETRYGDDAVGLGYYVRAGLERRLTEGLLLGLGARWFDADLDFSDEFDDAEFSGTQFFLTLSQNF